MTQICTAAYEAANSYLVAASESMLVTMPPSKTWVCSRSERSEHQSHDGQGEHEQDGQQSRDQLAKA